MKKALIVILSVVLILVGAIPALAQTSNTLTLTEEQINDSYRVTNTPRRAVTDAVVDLQPGQVVITATMRVRGHNPVSVSATYVPSLNNGRVYWTASAATVNGKDASADMLTQINDAISSSWLNYFRTNAGTGKITAITITDTEITATRR